MIVSVGIKPGTIRKAQKLSAGLKGQNINRSNKSVELSPVKGYSNTEEYLKF